MAVVFVHLWNGDAKPNRLASSPDAIIRLFAWNPYLLGHVRQHTVHDISKSFQFVLCRKALQPNEDERNKNTPARGALKIGVIAADWMAGQLTIILEVTRVC